MKSKFQRLVFTALVLLLGSIGLHAASPVVLTPNISDVSAGMLNLEFVQSYTSALSASKISWSFHGTHATSNPSIRGFRVYAGIVDTNTGRGEFTTVGNIEAIGPSMSLELRHLTLDTAGATGVITAEVLLNGVLSGRIPVFNLVTSANFSVPFTGASFQTPTVGFTVTDSFAALFNNVFSSPILAQGMTAGSISASGTIGTIE